MSHLSRFRRLAVLAGFAVVLAMAPTHAKSASPPPVAAPAPAERTFTSPDEAVTALIDAVTKHDLTALRAVLGAGSEALIESGDPVADAETRQHFLDLFQQKHSLAADGPDRMNLIVGPDDWPLPLPIVKEAAGWRFDSRLGAEQIVDRRIGRNEIAAIRVSLAYVDAQKLYFETSAKTGTGEYAQFLVSHPGKHDGLYWTAEEGEAPSPLAPLVEQAQEEGYPGELVAGHPIPYQGYYFRILKGQGPDASGGARTYVTGARMTGGFGLVAWPARYGASGVTTFIVNQDGVVFQKDLGPQTTAIATAIKVFDPAITWARIDVTE